MSLIKDALSLIARVHFVALVACHTVSSLAVPCSAGVIYLFTDPILVEEVSP